MPDPILSTLHVLPFLILQPYEVGKIITHMNDKDETKGHLETHSPRKVCCMSLLRSSYTKISTQLPKPLSRQALQCYLSM